MICFDIDRPLLGVGQVPRGKKLQKNHKKFTKQWQILPCKKLGLAPPSCPSFSFRPESGKRAAELQRDTQKGFTLHCSQMGPLQDIWALRGTFLAALVWIWEPFFVQGLHFRLKNAKSCESLYLLLTI